LCEGGGNYPVTVLTDPVATPTLFVYTQDSLVAGGISGGTDVNANNIPVTGPHSVQLIVTNGACTDTTEEFFRILPIRDPSFEYVPFEYCQDGNFPYPNIIGDPGGIFTSDSLVFTTGTDSSSTGEVNLAASPTGPHDIYYEVGGPLCPERDTFQISIIPSNEAEFSYGGNLFCTYDTIILPLGNYTLDGFSATTQAVWDSTINPNTVFLPINDTTGAIDMPNAIPGEYQIRHDLGTGGVCQLSFTLIISIYEAAQGVTLTYPIDSLCPNVANPVPTLTGDFNPGSFASTPNVTYAGPDGEINLAATDSGTHVINYVTEGECPLVISDTIYIEELLSAEFDYGSPTNLGFYCTSEDSAAPFYVLNQGGTFWAVNRFSDPIVLIDPQTGVFDLTGVTSNDESPYTIFYSPPSACKDTAQDIIQISLGPDSTGFFVTPGDTICEGEEATFFAFGGNSFTFYRDSIVIPKDSLDGETFRILDSLNSGEEISVAIQNSASCVARDTIQMTVITKPVLNLIQTPRTISSGQNSTLLFSSSVNGTFFDWIATSVGQVEFVPSSATEGPAQAWAQEDLVTTVILEDETSPAQIFFTITPWIQVTPFLTCTGEPLADTVLVNPQDEAIFIPEIITPNGDIFNETWQIQWREDIEASDYTMYLFNRSGGQILAMSPLNAIWNGDDNPDGVYWWKLVNNRTGQTERTGGLTIIRRER
jgi:gliding motility-associated-like protein